MIPAQKSFGARIVMPLGAGACFSLSPEGRGPGLGGRTVVIFPPANPPHPNPLPLGRGSPPSSRHLEMQDRDVHSALILPSTITFFHLSNSALRISAPCCGLVPRGSTPTLASAVFTSGLCSVLAR